MKKPSKQDTTGKPWARYLRLSKLEAREIKGATKAERMALTLAKLDAHCKELTAWLDRNGLPYSDDLIFKDPGLSAWKRNVKRPGWDKMMELADAAELAGIGIVAVDRFTRDVIVMENLIRLAETTDVKIGGPRAGNLDLTTYEGIQQARGMAVQAANESLATSHRLMETMQRKMAAGQPMGAGRMFGFQMGGVMQEPEEAAIVRDVVTRHIAGESLGALARELNERGILTTRGNEWTHMTLGRTICRPRYGGHVERHGEIVGQIKDLSGEDPILDTELYESLQALRASRVRTRPRSGNFLLTGMLDCSDCKIPMNGCRRHKRLANGTKARQYRCPPDRGGCGRIISATHVEEMVEDYMIRLLADPRHYQRIVSADAQLGEKRTEALAQQAIIQGRLTALEARWATGVTDDAGYDVAKPILDRQMAKAVEKLAALEPERAMQNYNPRTEWERLNDDEKRAVMRTYRVRIDIARQPLKSGFFCEERVKISKGKKRPFRPLRFEPGAESA